MIYTCFAVSLAQYARMEQLLRQPVLFSVLPISKSKCWRRNTKIENNCTHKSIALSVPVVCPRLARLNSADHGWNHLAAWWAAAYMLSPLSRESHRRSIMVDPCFPPWYWWPHAFHHVLVGPCFPPCIALVGPCFPPCKPPSHLFQSIVWLSNVPFICV